MSAMEDENYVPLFTTQGDQAGVYTIEKLSRNVMYGICPHSYNLPGQINIQEAVPDSV